MTYHSGEGQNPDNIDAIFSYRGGFQPALE
jgi:hypothetical protein